MQNKKNSILAVFFTFSGRATRTHWWSLFAIAVLGGIVAAFIDISLGYETEGPAFIVLFLLLLWPSLAVTIKRWHDRDKSGFWILISFIPLIGPLWALIENGFLGGTPGPNRFGPNPRDNAT